MRSRMASVFIFLSLFMLAGCGGNVSTPPAPSPTVPATAPTPSGPPPLSLYFSTMTPGVPSAATPEAAAQSVVSALDASTGKLRWTYTARAQVQNVPVVDQDTLYVGADDHTVYALNAGDGSLRWKASVAGEPHVITVQNGVVYGDTELSTAGRPTRGPLFALNAQNGASVWLSQVNGSFFGLIDGAVYMVGADNQLYALDAGTGSARWHFPINGPFNGLRVVSGRVYLLTAHAAGYTSSVVLYALDTSTGALQWRYPVQVKDLENLSLVGADDSALYLLSSEQQNLGSLPLALALKASDGSVLWQHQASGTTTAFTAATLDNGIVYLGTDNGLLVALNAQDGSLRWQTKVTTTAMNIALVNEGVIYVSVSGEGVTALKTRNGAVLWHYQSADYVGISSARDPVLYGFSLSSSFSATSHNYVLALRESNGSLLWRYDAGTSSIFPVLSA